MNNDNHELQLLLIKLDSIVDEIKEVLVSTKLVSSNKKETQFFLSKQEDLDVKTRILVKIDKYKKLRADAYYPYISKLEVTSVMDIFAITQNLIKKLSEGRSSSEHADNGFFDKFSDISQKIERLVA